MENRTEITGQLEDILINLTKSIEERDEKAAKTYIREFAATIDTKKRILDTASLKDYLDRFFEIIRDGGYQTR